MIFYVFTQKLKENVGGLFGAGGGAKGMLAPLKLLGGGGGGGWPPPLPTPMLHYRYLRSNTMF